MNPSEDEPEESLRWVKSRPGSHRPKSRASRGYDRDMWHGDRGTEGPTESKPADDVLEMAQDAADRADHLERELAEQAQRLQWTERALEEERADRKTSTAGIQPGLGSDLADLLNEVLSPLTDAVVERLSTREGRQELLEMLRIARHSAVGRARELLDVLRRMTTNAESAPPSMAPDNKGQPTADTQVPQPSYTHEQASAASESHDRDKASCDGHDARHLEFVALREAAARLGWYPGGTEQSEAGLSPELEWVLRAALEGIPKEFSPAESELLVRYWRSPYSVDSQGLVELSPAPVQADRSPLEPRS